MTRRRIDAVLVDRGLFGSRERARAAVLAGDVRVDGVVARKAGDQVADDALIEVARKPQFVSRGGDKLAEALRVFCVAVAGRRTADVGASTGGFTDCLLQAGAASVAAVDVGYGQLAWSLRNDQRVTVFERTNIRYADPLDLGAPFDVVVADVSFISLRTVAPSLVSLVGEGGELMVLVKPQFEVGKARVGKRGVVREPEAHADALAGARHAIEQAGLTVRGMTFSPLKGPEGNIEFWIWASPGGQPVDVSVEEVVADAHERLGK